MATMTAAQRMAELQRKKNLGIQPTDKNNLADYNKLTKMPTVSTATKPTTGLTNNSGLSPNVSQAMKTAATTAKTNTTPKPIGAAASVVSNLASRFPVNTTQSFTPRLETTLSNFQNAVNTPFQYDPNSDQAFNAYQNAALQALATTQANTNARLRASGQGRSSYSETVQNQLGNQAAQDIANTMITTYLPQAYKQYQDNLANQQALYNMQYQQDVATPMQEAELTGTYLTGPAREALQNLLGLKQQAEAPGITGDQRNVLSQQADKIRAFLQTQGVNPSLFGANVSSNQASQNMSLGGMRTLAAQNQDFNQNLANQQLEMDQMKLNASLTGRLPDGTPTTAEQQRQLQNLWTVADATGTIPDALANMYGLPQGMQTQAAKQWALNFNRGVYESDRAYNRDVMESDRNYALNLAQENRLSNQNNQADTGESFNDASKYIDSVVRTDEDTGAITNLDTVKNLILNSGLSDYDTWRLYQKYGIPWEAEIPTKPGN